MGAVGEAEKGMFYVERLRFAVADVRGGGLVCIAGIHAHVV